MNTKTMTFVSVLLLAILKVSSAHAAALYTNASASVTVPPVTTATSAHTSNTATDPSTSSGQTASITALTVNGQQVSAKAVSSDIDLNAYTKTVIASDTAGDTAATANDNAQIKNVTYQDNGVTVEFTQPAKFLGLFPTNIDAHATVQADGSVIVNYPWYGFLIRKHKDAITNIFQTQVNAATAGKANLNAIASASLAPQTKALLLDAMRQAIHGLRTKAAVQSSTNASVK